MSFCEFSEVKRIIEALNCKASFFCAGTDEAGRGPLAGPVVGACAYVKCSCFEDFQIAIQHLEALGVNDSKKLTKGKRKKILDRLEIHFSKEVKQSFRFGPFELVVQAISEEVIDDVNILNASLTSMKESFLSLFDFETPGVVLVDGNSAFELDSKLKKIDPLVKGDSKSKLIGLASIIAKEFRDFLMEKFDEEFPLYGFKKHSGYPTKTHREAIKQYGPCSIHRKSFRGVREFILEE